MVMWVVVIIAVAFIIVIIAFRSPDRNYKEELKQSGYDTENRIETGKYIAGHPDIDKSIEKTSIFHAGNNIEIMEEEIEYKCEKKAVIEITKIKNIIVEDESSIEKKVTVGRLLAVGVFAFALKKNVKNELAYLTLEWNDGKFDHETIFEFAGSDAMQKANTARNKLIRIAR